MNDRFSPKWNRLKKPIDELIRVLDGSDHLLVESFLEVSLPNLKSKTAEDVKRELRGIVMSPGIPWIFFDTITNLIKKLPGPTKKSIIEAINIDTGHAFEQLQPKSDGTWQVVWQLDPDKDNDEQYIALDWYAPPEIDKAPIVPIGVMDYVAGSVSLMRSNLILPAIAVLLIALEASIWHSLTLKGISRTSEKTVYKSVKWHFRKLSKQLVFTIEGSDENLDRLDSVVGKYPAVGSFDLRKTSVENSKVILRAELDESLGKFFASDLQESHEVYSEKGLSEAVQRARKAEILQTLPIQLDDTIIRLRNNLIHLSFDGIFDPTVPSPSGGRFVNHDELRQEPQLVKDLIHLVVELINNLYAFS